MALKEKPLHVYFDRLKPPIFVIKSYLKNRLSYSNSEVGFKNDLLGNLEVTPFGATEQVLDGPTSSRIVISPRGKEILIQNKGFLHKVSNPRKLDSGRQNRKMKGREARIVEHEARLSEETIYLAIKYQFATLSTSDKTDIVTFTPQIDAMRIAQITELNQPIPGLQIVVPLISTIDMSVSTFIERGITLDWLTAILQNLVSFNELKVDKEDKKLLKEIIEYDENQTNPHPRFLSNYIKYSMLASAGLANWLSDRFSNPQQYPFELVHKGWYSFKESEKFNNKLISIPGLYKLWGQWKASNTSKIPLSKKYKDDFSDYFGQLNEPGQRNFTSASMENVKANLNEEQRKFLVEVKKTFYILELIIGSEKLDKIPSKKIHTPGYSLLALRRQLQKLRLPVSD